MSTDRSGRLSPMQSSALAYLDQWGSAALHGGGYSVRTWRSLERRGLCRVVYGNVKVTGVGRKHNKAPPPTIL